MDPQQEQVFRSYAWSYFSFHADQRMKTFNFFLIVAGLLANGIVTLLKDGNNPWLTTPFGLALMFLCFLFWRLDRRNHTLVRNGEGAIKYLDSLHEFADSEGVPHPLRIFERDDYLTSRQPRSVFRLKGHFSYSQVIKYVYGLFAALGLLLLLASFLPHQAGPAQAKAGRTSGTLNPSQPATSQKELLAGAKAPVPPLTAVHIVHVNSADNPLGEDITDGQITTTSSYGGAWLQILTTEEGYGENEVATLQSSIKGTNTLKKPLPDVPGQTATGWQLTWQFKPCAGGQFLFSAESQVGIAKHSAMLNVKPAAHVTP